MKHVFVLFGKRFTSEEKTASRYNLSASITKKGVNQLYEDYKSALKRYDDGILEPFEEKDKDGTKRYFYNRMDAGNFQVLTFEKLPLF